MKKAQQDARNTALRNVPPNTIGEFLHGKLHTRPYDEDSQHVRVSLLESLRKTAPLIDFLPEIHVGADVLVPDVAVWVEAIAAAKQKALGRYSSKRYALAPNLVFDVVPPPLVDASYKKLDSYHNAGIDHVVFIDPVNRVLEVYRRRFSIWVMERFRGRQKVQVELHATVEIDLGLLWPSPREIEEAQQAAATAVGNTLDELVRDGADERELLRAMLTALPPTPDTAWEFVQLFDGFQYPLLRAWALAAVRVPLEQALTLGKLEVTAEHQLRSAMTEEEDNEMRTAYLRNAISEAEDELEEGEGVSAEEFMRELREKHLQPESHDDDPLWGEVQGEIASFRESGELPVTLHDRVVLGPGTRYIAHEDWASVLGAVAKAGVTQAWPKLEQRVDELVTAAEHC